LHTLHNIPELGMFGVLEKGFYIVMNFCKFKISSAYHRYQYLK